MRARVVARRLLLLTTALVAVITAAVILRRKRTGTEGRIQQGQVEAGEEGRWAHAEEEPFPISQMPELPWAPQATSQAEGQMGETAREELDGDREGRASLETDESTVVDEPPAIDRPRRGRRADPQKRGGRPRGPIEAPKPLVPELRQRGPKPEIVCWKRERVWVVAIEVPEHLLSAPDLAVTQDALPLTRDNTREACWLLERTSGQLVVEWVDSEAAALDLGEEPCLLFKLSGQNRNEGRRVRHPTVGSFLAIVPDNWERNDALSGPAQVAPELASLEGYQAHFFNIETDGIGRIAFCAPQDKSAIIERRSLLLELVGARLHDASEDMGPLFGEGPPRLRAQDAQVWNHVATIVIGQEGPGRRKWRTQFKPTPHRLEQELPRKLAVRRGGWYFLRLYDSSDDLVDSMDFRFLSALRDLTIAQPAPLPSASGHGPVRAEFFHGPQCEIEPRSGSEYGIQIERGADGTVVTIPPDPMCDETRWFLGPESGPKVEVTILVERVWWAIGEEHVLPSVWVDRPIGLTRQDLAATSRKAVWLRLPRAGWTDCVLVGFRQSSARRYPVKVAERVVAVPLRDLGDAPETQALGKAPLNSWLQATPTTLCELTVKLGCRLCEFSAYSEKALLEHVQSCHIHEFFRALTYDEMRKLNPALPLAIYQCPYCGFYVKSVDLVNPTTAIDDHELHCSEAVREMGKVVLRFRVIHDVEEIRKNVDIRLSLIHVCQLCGTRVEEATQSDMVQHLIQKHRRELYRLV